MTTLQTAEEPLRPPKPADLVGLLEALYRAQLEDQHDEYLAARSSNSAVLRRHVDVFERYRQFIPGIVSGGQVLDWGCRHAVDSCLLRATLGERVRLFGCDVSPPVYGRFHDFARLQFTRLRQRDRLPYRAHQFDAVIGSGVLEHVPNDGESLSELHRIMKNGGVLVLTFLPNRASVSEFLGRVRNRSHHLRLYSRRSIRDLLLHHGFHPQLIEYHQVMPTLAGGDRAAARFKRLAESLYRLNPILERTPLLRRLAANLLVVARKRNVM